jgi:hypothetical protein
MPAMVMVAVLIEAMKMDKTIHLMAIPMMNAEAYL